MSETESQQPTSNKMILCGGMQSGGTTLISYCFLQRPDMNGVLDMKHDILQTDFGKTVTPILWVKMTVSCFQLKDALDFYGDLGYNPQPTLIVRDMRAAYASLLRKPYGINGTTAEDPPLRMRFRRFLDDWKLCADRGWPIIRFESALANGQEHLTAVCEALDLPWDEAMVSWPKQLADIDYAGVPNKTFADSISAGGLAAAIKSSAAEITACSLPPAEQEWVEKLCEEYNKANDYPAHVQNNADAETEAPRLTADFGVTRREKIRAEIVHAQWIARMLAP